MCLYYLWPRKSLDQMNDCSQQELCRLFRSTANQKTWVKYNVEFWMTRNVSKSWHLLAIFSIAVECKQLAEQKCRVTFLFIMFSQHYVKIISGLTQWCFVPSVFINEAPFFSVSKHKIYLVWNQVVGTLFWLLVGTRVDGQFPWSFQSVGSIWFCNEHST